MAEVVGTLASALSIAALFKTCLDAFDLVQAARHQEADHKRLWMKLNIQKCRLYTWGQMMRLTDTSQHGGPRPLDSFQFRDLVIEALQTLHDLFNDSQAIQGRYGCHEALVTNDSNEEVAISTSLAAAFSHFQTGPNDKARLRLVQRARWAIRDKRKFEELVSETKELVDGLQEITKSIVPMIVQESAMATRITTIADVNTLQLVSEVCVGDHPTYSQAASLKSEVLSLPDTKRAEIEAWLADETPLSDPEMTELENMDLPELKHHVLSLLRQRQQLEDNYHTLIRHSEHLIPLSQNKLKTLVAKAKSEGTSIRILSLLSMVYLPSTFVATALSTSHIDTTTLDQNFFWMFFAFGVPPTFAALFWFSRH